MKKTVQFLFAMCILMDATNSFAGTNEPATTPDKPVLTTTSITTSRGIQVLLLTVVDDSFKPIAGATVNAPCTGQGAKVTDSNGNVQFSISGTCACNEQTAYITTPAGCATHINLTCTGTNEAVCGK